MRNTNISAFSMGFWRTGKKICAFANSERHLGHILKLETQWLACDGTRLAESGSGFRIIGVFPDPDSAKRAVEAASFLALAATPGTAGTM
jgi:hypothetical protein